MKVIKDLYLIITLLVLMLLRPWAPGNWFGSVVVAGLLVTWLDTLNHIWEDNSTSNDKEKVRYGVIFTIMGLIGLSLLILLVINLVKSIEWLNSTIVLDELTLLALLLCVSQKSFINLLGNIIKKGKNWYKE